MTEAIQQQLVAARRNQILEAAAVVFAEKGFHPATIKDVAKQAGIADGTIYNYFDSKTGLLLGIFDRMRASIMQGELPDPAAEIDLRTFIRTLLHHPLVALRDDNFALFRIVVSEMMVNEELRALYNEQILAPTLAVAEGYFRERAVGWGLNPADAGLTIRAISGMVLGVMVERIMGDPTLVARWDELPDFLTDLILHGLGTDNH